MSGQQGVAHTEGGRGRGALGRLDGAAASMVRKWCDRRAELRLAEVFLRGPTAGLELAWACVLAEWHEAMFAVQDARVALTKLEWWGRDLAQGSASAHPLGRIVAGAAAERGIEAARWTQAADAARLLAIHEEVDSEVGVSIARWLPFAEAVAALERDLLDHEVDAGTVSAQWRTELLLQQLDSVSPTLLPMNLRAKFGAPERWCEALPEGWSALAAAWGQPASGSGGHVRQLRHRLQRRFWRGVCAGSSPTRAAELRPLSLLWHSWRAARAARPQ